MPQPTTPLLTVDTIIEMLDQPERKIVLIQRKHPPRGWALPGGFVDVGETLEQAAEREAREETGLDVRLVSLLGCYSDPARDPRGHTVSAVFIGGAAGVPVAHDDAAEARWFNLNDLPSLVFDHALILGDYKSYLETGKAAPLR